MILSANDLMEMVDWSRAQFAMTAIYLLGGFDRLSVNGRWSELGIVRRFPILQ